MKNTATFGTKIAMYHGFTITASGYGTFNVTGINCFGTPTIESAQRAIERYAEAHDLCEHGVPKAALEPVCGCPGRKYIAGIEDTYEGELDQADFEHAMEDAEDGL